MADGAQARPTNPSLDAQAQPNGGRTPMLVLAVVLTVLLLLETLPSAIAGLTRAGGTRALARPAPASPAARRRRRVRRGCRASSPTATGAGYSAPMLITDALRSRPAPREPAAVTGPAARRARRGPRPRWRGHVAMVKHVPERLGVGDVVGLGLGHRDVGDHAGALPVRAGDRVDRARERDADVHRGADRERPGRVGAAAGCLADDLGPAQRLQRVAEVLAAGERPAAGQHVDRAVDVAGARHVAVATRTAWSRRCRRGRCR